MKKLFIALLAVVMVMSLCACSSETSDETQPLKEFTSESLFVNIGDTMTINGQTVTASSFGQYSENMGNFHINRLTGEIVILKSYKGYTYSMSTGLYWPEDTVEVNGYEVPILHQNAE